MDKGVQRMEKAMSRVRDSQDRTQRDLKQSSHDKPNFMQAFRDFSEGRTANAMARMGGNMALIGSIGLIAANRVRELHEQISELTTVSQQYADQSAKSNRAALFKIPENGSSGLAAERAAAEERLKAGDQALKAIDDKTDFAQSPVFATGYRATQALDKGLGAAGQFLGEKGVDTLANLIMPGFGGGLSRSLGLGKSMMAMGHFTPIEDARNQAELTQDANRKTLNAVAGKYTRSLELERDTAASHAPGTDPLDAHRRELQLQKQSELAAAGAANASEKDKKIIEERYAILEKTIDAEEELNRIRFQSQSSLAGIEGSARSAFSKSLASSAEKRREAQERIKSGLLSPEENRAAQLQMFRAENATRDTIQSRYLNPDGTRRSESDIQADFRNDRAQERAAGRFRKIYDAGGFDPRTGRRRATGDKPGSGLHTGSLGAGPAGGGLRGASMALGDEDWNHLFPRRKKEGMFGPSMSELVVPARPHGEHPHLANNGSAQIVEHLIAIENRLPRATA